MTQTIYILRHAETDLNRLGIVQGQGVDAELNETGRWQAEAFFHTYGHLPFEAVLTSTLKRTHQTVAPFLEKGLPWQQFPELDEIGWGIHEGKVPTEPMRREYSRIVEAWGNGRLEACVSGGESAARLSRRLRRFIEHLRTRPERLLLVCTHGRAMRCLICLMKGQPPSRMSLFGHTNTGLYVAHANGCGYRFELENDLRHLRQLDLPADR